MDREQALQTIGLDNSATQEQVASACKTKSEQLALRISSAPTPALRAKYETALEEIGIAAGVLGVEIIDVLPRSSAPARDTPLSHTKLQDLPSSRPTPTMSDSNAATLHDMQVAQQLGLQQGQVLAGRYEVRQLIGMGGMGAVYSTYDRHLDEEIAIKVLTPSLLKNEQAQERFLNEARTSARLSHPNIVNVHDVQREGELFFITMELLRGESLRQEMESRKEAGQPFTLEETKGVAKAVGEALHFAHGTTIHRDVKPENIWIGADGQIKLMDFGIARVLSTSRMTQTAMVMGTAYYMAPEQLQGSREVDARADQYALGVVLYEMLTGRLPAGRAKSVRALRPAVPDSVSAAIDKALEGDPADRFESIPTFLAQLDGKAMAPKRKAAMLAGAAAVVLIGGLAIAFTGPGNRVGRRIADFVIAPAVVRDLAVQNAAQRAITLKWDNEPPNATKMLVLRSENSREGYAPVGEVDPGVKAYTDDRSVEPEKPYYYKVIARNSAGKYSSVIDTPFLKAESLPVAPAAPAQLEIARKSTKELELTWKGKYPPGATATVLRSSTANEEFKSIAENLQLVEGENRYTDAEDLQPDTEYFYKVIAAYKGVSSPAVPAKAQRTLPVPPAKPDVKPADVTQTTVKLTWPNDYKPGTTMKIERSELRNSNYQVISEAHDAALGTFEDAVEPKKQYFYKLTALQDTQPSAVVGPIEVTTKPPQPGVVTALKGTARDGKVLLTWAAATDPSLIYRVRHLAQDTSQPVVLAELRAEQTNYEHPVAGDKDMKYEVVSVNGGVESAVAAVTVPAAPKLTAKSSEHGAQLDWTATGAASNFIIYRVDVSRVPEKLAETTEKLFVDNTSKPGMEYDYFVAAVSPGQGVSESARQKVATALDVPQNVRITAKDAKSAEITWQKATATTVAGYEIERVESGTSAPVRFRVDGTATTYLDAGLVAGKTYVYTVSAVDVKGERATSFDAYITMAATAASTPASTRGSGSGGISRRTSGTGIGGGGGARPATPAPTQAPRHTASPQHTPPPKHTPAETPCPPGMTPARTPPARTPPPRDPRPHTPTPAASPTSDPRVTTPPFPTPPIKTAPTFVPSPTPMQRRPGRRPMDQLQDLGSRLGRKDRVTTR